MRKFDWRVGLLRVYIVYIALSVAILLYQYETISNLSYVWNNCEYDYPNKDTNVVINTPDGTPLLRGVIWAWYSPNSYPSAGASYDTEACKSIIVAYVHNAKMDIYSESGKEAAARSFLGEVQRLVIIRNSALDDAREGVLASLRWLAILIVFPVLIGAISFWIARGFTGRR